jgi:anti-anti-sigma factor
LLEEQMEILQTSLSGMPLLRVTGDVDHSTSAELDAIARSAHSLDSSRLLVDFTSCPYMDSGGLGVLLTIMGVVRDKGWLGVIGPNPNLMRLFKITGLASDPAFLVFTHLEEASAAVRSTTS